MNSYTNKGSLVSYEGLVRMVEDGIITGVPPENINGSSIDITLHNEILGETSGDHPPVMLYSKQNINMEPFTIPEDGTQCLVMGPGDFILASSREYFNLPPNISAEYKLKSSMARNALEHLNAGWCDPCWNGSRLTLEFKNMSQHHSLGLIAGMKIGQITFWECDPVPDGEGYDVKGQYNKQDTVTESKGIK
ncbi:dCTP deaminase [bacterium]|nr:dCTP deaminase [bacterium]